ncbi:LysE family translocator [Pararhizobium haloflavum]|uniref:LysE family translocator n=1 Tax=Pararhizobium haloflavum TaxID=2037914 RepID=UPI0012FFD7E7|nr:LysE family translocator [Pararhizobium haloflavum]
MLVVAMAAPGPNLVAAASTALGSGRRAGFAVVCGIASGSFLWALASSFGLSVVFTLHPPLFLILKVGGGLYLCYLGLRALLAAWRNVPGAIRADAGALSIRAGYRRGLTICLLNPKSALFWASISAFVLSSEAPSIVIFEFCLVAGLSSCAIYGTYVLLFSSELAQRIYRRAMRWFEAAFGLFFVLVGGQLLVSR